MMGKPITVKKSGDICFAFPDVCKTPAALGAALPYPNIGDLGDATNVSDGSLNGVFAGKKPIVHEGSEIGIGKTSGNEAAAGGGGIKNGGVIQGKVTFTTASQTVFVNGKGVVRMFDATEQNNGNAVGIVLGGVPTVFVGG